MAQQELSVSQIIARVVDALSVQLEVQAELLKAELAQGMTTLAQDLLPIVVASGLFGLGYTLINIGLVLTLATALGLWGGLLLIGALNVLLSGLVLQRASARVQARQAQSADDQVDPATAETLSGPNGFSTQTGAPDVR
ncbi:MAG: hypothetical protein RIT28_1266 [Pseudomonadota bacterium]|jgi:hypothetical protein